jgi:virulence-associated protein VagC
MEGDMAVRPQDVKSPKDHWVLIDVLIEKQDWSLAVGEYDGERCLAARWNGDDDRPKGNPVSHGMPTWFVLPREFAAPLLAADLIPEEKKSLARTYLGLASTRNRWDDFFLNGPRVSDDFMRERDQPPAQDREPL